MWPKAHGLWISTEWSTRGGCLPSALLKAGFRHVRSAQPTSARIRKRCSLSPVQVERARCRDVAARNLVRELVGADKVAPPDLLRSDPELRRAAIDEPFHEFRRSGEVPV